MTLLPGQVATFTATYTASQPDLNFGSVTDTANAKGTDPNGNTITSVTPSTVTIPAQAAHLPVVIG